MTERTRFEGELRDLGLELETAPTRVPILDAAQVQRAVSRNRFYMVQLGWQAQEDRIVDLLGLPPVRPPMLARFTAQDFAQAVAAWQRSQGFTGSAVDGIIGPNTWQRMQAVMSASDAASLAQPSPAQPTLPPEGTFRLRYEGEPGRERLVSRQDPEFRQNYIDYNISDTLADVQIDVGNILRWEIRYRDGRTKVFDANEFEAIHNLRFSAGARASLRIVTVSYVDHFLRRTDGFIYPVNPAGSVFYDNRVTPNIVWMRSILDVKARGLRDVQGLRDLLQQFWPAGTSGMVGIAGQGLAGVQSIIQRAADISDLALLRSLL